MARAPPAAAVMAFGFLRVCQLFWGFFFLQA
jgi:hypothetical protein